MTFVKITRKSLLLLFVLGSIAIPKAYSQFYQLSQFYSSPTLLAPSFTGLVDGSRVAVNYRDQWPGIPGQMVTYGVAYDQYFPKWRSGFGIQMLRDVAGDTKLGYSNLGLLYSFDFKISDDWHVRPGAQFKYSHFGLDKGKAIFGDQLIVDGAQISTQTSSIDIIPYESKIFPDITASLMVYSSKFWIGGTVDHLVRPDISLVEDEPFRLDYQYYGFMGAKFNIRRGSKTKFVEESVTFSALYKYSETIKQQQLDVGLYWTYTPLVLGLYFRGMPFLNSGELTRQYQDAIIVLFGYKMYNLSLGYSYDITISNLNIAKGAHEVSIIYNFSYKVDWRVRGRRTAVPCPKF